MVSQIQHRLISFAERAAAQRNGNAASAQKKLPPRLDKAARNLTKVRAVLHHHAHIHTHAHALSFTHDTCIAAFFGMPFQPSEAHSSRSLTYTHPTTHRSCTLLLTVCSCCSTRQCRVACRWRRMGRCWPTQCCASQSGKTLLSTT
jgi:hypothetical protein